MGRIRGLRPQWWGSGAQDNFEEGPWRWVGVVLLAARVRACTGGRSVNGRVTALGSHLTALIDGSGHRYVNYVGTNGQIWENYWSGTGWSNAQIVKKAEAAATGASPTALFDGSGHRLVYYVGADGHIWEDYFSGSAWSNSRPTKGQQAASNAGPASLIDAAGHRFVYYVGANGQIWETYFSGSAWSNGQTYTW